MAMPHEEKPLGLQIPPVPAGTEIPPEPPDVGARALSVAARLLAGATTFFFVAFVFAYFYLRSQNIEHMWKPAHVKPDQGLGVAFIVCLLLSVASAIVAGRGMKSRTPGWTRPALASVVLGLAAVAVQCVEYTQQKFGPTNGAYASVFCAWTAFYMIAVLGVMYWLETQVATEIRASRQPADPSGDIKDPDLLIAPGLDAAVFYWGYLGAIGVLTYVVLYLL
jgi:heme/copper-type cytochrome/quinol oxidase subunit 3